MSEPINALDALADAERSFDAILADAQNIGEETTPDEVEALLEETINLSAVSRRRVMEAIKKQANLPFSVQKELLREKFSATELDHLELARKVIDEVGSQNILSSAAFVYRWDDKGVWRKLEERAIRQVIQHNIENSVDEVSRGIVESITDLFKTEIYRPEHAFDIGPVETVNCLNGEVSLIDGRWHVLPHNREHYRTTQIPVIYDPDAVPHRFLQFLAEVFEGDEDAANKAQAIWEMIGYSLMAHCRHERFVILVGSGANGKSVFLVVLEGLLGSENIAGVQPSQFDRSFQRAHLHGKLANIVTEIKQGEVIDDASLKGIVSGEPTTVEHKFKDPFTMRPFATCWFGTNHMPHTRDFSDALFRRALVIQFNRIFKPELGNCDPQLKDRLLMELPGILAFALDAYAQALMHGFTMPESSKKARDEWRLEADQVAQFVEECCVRLPSSSIRPQMLFDHYRQWAEQNGIHKTLSMKSFRDRLSRLGFGKGRDRHGKLVEGIALQPEAMP
jgi:putative DNA primase/helicase